MHMGMRTRMDIYMGVGTEIAANTGMDAGMTLHTSTAMRVCIRVVSACPPPTLPPGTITGHYPLGTSAGHYRRAARRDHVHRRCDHVRRRRHHVR